MRSLVRRLGSLVTFALCCLGLSAAPASAAMAVPVLTVTGQVACNIDTGQFFVSWSVAQNSGEVGVFTDRHVEPPGSTVQGFDYKIFSVAAGPQSGGQTVPSGATSASLTVGVDFPSGHVEGTGTVAITGTCNRVVPLVSYEVRCDGLVLVTVVLPAGTPGAVSVEILQYNAAGASVGAGALHRITTQPSTATVAPEWAARIEVRQDGSLVRLIVPSPPAGCPGMGGGPTPGGGGLPGSTSPGGTGPAPGLTTSAPAGAQPTTDGPAPTSSTAAAPVPTAGGTTPVPGDADLSLAGLPVRPTVVSSLGIVALALAAAFFVVTLRRRRTRLAGVAAPPDSPPAAE
jgi:hypothetical protein